MANALLEVFAACKSPAASFKLLRYTGWFSISAHLGFANSELLLHRRSSLTVRRGPAFWNRLKLCQLGCYCSIVYRHHGFEPFAIGFSSTKRLGVFSFCRVVSARVSYSVCCPDRVSVVFLSPSRHTGIVPWIRPWPLPSIAFSIHYSLVLLFVYV